MPPAEPVASLPMYDWPEVRWAHDALWAAIAEGLSAAGVAAPAALDRARKAEAVWLDPGLVLSQTCGWPYATRLHGHVRLVATPIHDVEGCNGPFYSSAIVVRRNDAGGLDAFAARRFAFNAGDSLSGHVALRAEMKAHAIDPAGAVWVETGSHRASVVSVAAAETDCAAIDAVCWAMARRFEPAAVERLRVLGWTARRPALPLITAAGRSEADVAAIRTALGDALRDPAARAACAALRLAGLAVVDPTDYRALAALA